MIHYDENVAIVMKSLRLYGYPPRAIRMTEDCFTSLKLQLISQGLQAMSWCEVQHWCDGKEVSKERKNIYRATIRRLADVYEASCVSRNHLCFYYNTLPPAFTDAVTKYISSIAENYTDIHLENIRNASNRFLGFLHVNGIDSLDAIDYPLLEQYDKDGRQYNQAFYITEGLVEGFFFYLASQGICSYGFGWYMHFIQSGRVLMVDDFPTDLRDVLLSDCTSFKLDAGEMRQSMSGYMEALGSFGYSETMLGTTMTSLTLLFLFLDMNKIGYSRFVANIWLSAVGDRLFKSNILMVRRVLELYDDFIMVGQVDPDKWWKHHPSALELLPEWCHEPVSRFLDQKIREGKRPNTVTMCRSSVVRFCQFLITKGLESFHSVTPAIIKEFNAQDVHKTVEGKNAYNERIRKFLVFLYREGLHSEFSLYLALPKGSAPKDRIISVLTSEEKEEIRYHKENSVSALDLRDAAILELGTKMGFRGVDIVNLKLSDIDWKSRSIRLIQEKTGVENWLPMSVSVGNAIYRYLKDGRPPVKNEPYVFLKSRAPYNRVRPLVCADALERILPERNVPGSKFHVTRKTFATDLLKNGTPVSVIADALGHSDMTAVHKYLSLDEERMRLCPLSLSDLGLLVERGRLDG